MVTKTELVKRELAKNPNPTPQQIKEIAERVAKQHESGKCSKALVHKCLRKMPKPEPTGLPAPVEPVVTIKEEGEREVPEVGEVEEAEVVEEAEPVETLERRLEEGILTENDLTYVWQSVNSLFPEKHQRPDRSMELLGKLWMKPANRLIEKYSTENVDLYLAVGGTAIVFLPSIVAMIRERRKRPKPPKKEE